MSSLPTGTVTFLFTDIEGSTRLWDQYPDAMRSAITRHDQILRDAVECHGGYLVKTTGDGLHAAFSTAPAAVSAVLSAQCTLQSEPWPAAMRIAVRMGLHTGMSEMRGGDYYGGAVNRTARLMAAGHGGQVLISAATHALVCDHLPGAAGLRDLGEHRLKDLGRSEQVFQLLHPDLVAAFPPLRSLKNPALLNNLPQQPTSFIGRETQVAEVKSLLGRTRLLTLTGAGGAGKTRLSLQAAADLLDGDGDGVWLVELASLSDPALVPQAVADVLSVKEQVGQPVQQALVDWLKAKRLLLILDNCEHLVAACASLASSLLRSCPRVYLLASSREPLNVPGEQTYRVPSLSLPDPERPQTAETLTGFEAVRLFAERAQSVRPGFAVTDANAHAVAQVCFRLDGIPLAIELAAARVRSLFVDEINTRLDNRFRLLTGGSRTALPRQQTLKALVDWSYDLLAEGEKTLLRRLSVFAGGWTLSAAEGVCSGVGMGQWEVLDMLTGLVDKSLAVYEVEEGGGERYHFLETIRQYAQDLLGESGEGEAVQRRAALWFLGFAEKVEPQARVGSEQKVWLDRLDAEHDNLRASLSWFQHEAEGVEKGLRLAAALNHFWWIRGHYSEGRLRLDHALARKQEKGQDDADGKRIGAARAKALGGAAHLASEQGDTTAARAMYEESVSIQRQIQDYSSIGWSLTGLGRMALKQGDLAEARAFFEEGLALRRQAADHWGIVHSLISMGYLTFSEGDLGDAGALFREALTLAHQIGDQIGNGWALTGLARLAFRAGDHVQARALHRESLAIFRHQRDLRGIVYTLVDLGNVAMCLDDLAETRVSFLESLVIARRLGDLQAITMGLEGIAEVAQRQSQPSRAIQLISVASSLRESAGLPRSRADTEKMDQAIASAREVLGEAAFAAAWDVGWAMTRDEAIEYSL